MNDSVWPNLLLVASLTVFCDMTQAAIVRTDPGSDKYSVVALSESKDVYFKWCDVADYPKADCQPKWTAIALARGIFDAKIKGAGDFDSLVSALKKQVSDLESRWIPELNRYASSYLAAIEASRKVIDQQQASIDRIVSQIQAARQRLQQANLSANDKREIEKFIQESETTVTMLGESQTKEKTTLAQNKARLAENQKQLATAKRSLAQNQKDLQDRLQELADAAAKIGENLNSNSEIIAFKNESLYFVSGYVFDPSVTPMSECKVTSFVLPDGLGRANVAFDLTAGLFPLTAKTHGNAVQLKSGQNSMTVVYTEKSWLHSGDAYSFPNPFKLEETIHCKAPKVNVPGDFYFTGEQARYSYAGRFKRGVVHAVCKAIANGRGPSGGDHDYVFGIGTLWGSNKEDLRALQRQPLVLKTLVEGLAPLAKGYYAWANDEGSQVYNFMDLRQEPQRDWTESISGSKGADIELPTICSSIRLQ
jgi:peptidoglycan hydrolase CwlO-like protein